jgi:starch phosphorylase
MSPDAIRDPSGQLPPAIASVARLAYNLRWVWNHAADRVWEALNAEVWHRTGNPILVLQNTPRSRLDELARDAEFIERVRRLDRGEAEYMSRSGWFQGAFALETPPVIAYLSMEYGLTDALPLYSGGLGVLAGDHLKTASDLGIPLVAVGLFYREGYFRQMLDAAGKQIEIYAVNSRESLPVRQVPDAEGMPLRVTIALPGRDLYIRIWQVDVGRIPLLLLDSDDPFNSPFDRGITAKLYAGDGEARLMQEIVLGIGGWRALEALGHPVEVLHLNEGHAALATVERARSFAQAKACDFFTALWATRGGNVFTTHTPMAAAFDTFPLALVQKYGAGYARMAGIRPEQLMGLGRVNPDDLDEPFNMAYLAARTCARVNGVSELHGRVSRSIFAPLFPRWPEPEVPVTHVTNAVHVPSWDSPWADTLWTEACGKERWLGAPEQLQEAVGRLTDAQLWNFRGMERRDLVDYARRRLQRQLSQRGGRDESAAIAHSALDPNVLTLGFARRFTEYKRPAMLLSQPDRLARLLSDPANPVQIIIAGKAHPRDEIGRNFVRQWAEFVRRPAVRARAVFLEDYDMALAEQLVQGVDVWINTPRRPWEASGTSGMKVLVNGGLNLSELDGWWAEAYAPDVGWALGDGREHSEPGWDESETEQLYGILEREVVPAFYDRDTEGIPRAWVARIRASLSRLTPRFSSNRMLAEYLDRLYLPAATDCRRRSADNLHVARELRAWFRELRRHWNAIHWGNLEVTTEGGHHAFRVQVYLGELATDAVAVELYAEPRTGGAPERISMRRDHALAGASGGWRYVAEAPATRPPGEYTPRVVPAHALAVLPAEAQLIHWYAA